MKNEGVTFLDDRRVLPGAYIRELGATMEPLTERDVRPLRAVSVKDTLLERKIDDEWTAFYRIVQQDGVPIIAEMRIYPTESQQWRPIGTWSADVLGTAASAPRGGITPGFMRRRFIGGHYRSIITELAKWRQLTSRGGGGGGAAIVARALKVRGLRADPASLQRRRAGGRPRTDRLTYARAAVVYGQAWSAGKPPLRAVMSALGVTRSTARGIVSRARREGFLVPRTVKQGTASGQPTRAARALWPVRKTGIKRRRGKVRVTLAG